MEYRRRGSGTSSKRRRNNSDGSFYRKKGPSGAEHGSGALAVLMPIAAFAAVLYLLLATPIGDMLASKAGKASGIKGLLPESCAEGCRVQQTAIPLQPSALASDAPSPSPYSETSARPSIKVTLPRLNVYMLQMGVYSTESAAAERSQELKKLGAAGYVYNDNGNYRVILAAYSEEASASEVAERLNNEGYASTVFKLDVSGAELLITADDEQLTAVKTAFEYSFDLLKALEDASLSFDKDQLGIQDVKTLLAGIRSNAVNAAAGIGSCAQTNDILLYVYSYLNDVAAQTEEVIINASDERTEYASLTKRLRISSAVRYSSLLKQICG